VAETKQPQNVAQAQKPLDFLDQLAAFRDEGNEIFKQLLRHRVLEPYRQQFDEWKGRVQDYLDKNSQVSHGRFRGETIRGYALRFRSEFVDDPYPKGGASVRTRALVDELNTRIKRLDEYIRELTK
jgi:hypothetical protein